MIVETTKQGLKKMSNDTTNDSENSSFTGNTDVATSAARYLKVAGLAVMLPFAFLSRQREGLEAANDALYDIAERIKGE